MVDKTSTNTAQLKMQRLFWLIKANRFEEALIYVKKIREEFDSISRNLYADDLIYFESLAFKLQKIFEEIKQHRSTTD